MALLPHHREELHRSSLTDATIAALGVYSETDPRRIAEILNWSGSATLGAALVFPFRRPDGTLDGFSRVKPDKPRLSQDGRPCKYEQPKGASARAYLPPDVIPVLLDPSIVLLLTEGEKKAAAATQAGWPCIGLTGICNWSRPRERVGGRPVGDRDLIDDLRAVVWKGRTVAIVFDTDPEHNPDVAREAAELARVLETYGANVIIVSLPLGP
jgi:putative DNA primase/helicase